MNFAVVILLSLFCVSNSICSNISASRANTVSGCLERFALENSYNDFVITPGALLSVPRFTQQEVAERFENAMSRCIFAVNFQEPIFSIVSTNRVRVKPTPTLNIRQSTQRLPQVTRLSKSPDERNAYSTRT